MELYEFLFLNEGVIKIDLSKVKKLIRKCEVFIGFDLDKFDIIKVLNKNFNKLFINFKLNKGSTTNSVYKNGSILNANTNINSFEVTIEINEETIEDNFSSDEKYINFGIALLKIIDHEFIHVQQLLKMSQKNRNSLKKSNNLKDYLSNKLEIMTHAKNIIWDFLLDGYSKDEILKIISNAYSSKDKYISDNLIVYLDTFDKDSDVIKSLFKYIYQYIKE